jgi:superfamily I DNA/RNA helicase
VLTDLQIQPASSSSRTLPRQHQSLQIEFKTVHRSKGLEADYVIVAGMCSGKYGFPTEIADDPILDIVLAAPEGHPNAEERRLFYVALTRARRRAFLLADGGRTLLLCPRASSDDQRRYGFWPAFGKQNMSSLRYWTP